MARQRADRIDDLHQALEGEVLVGVGREVGLAYALQELAEGGVARRVRAQHEGVDEEPDEAVERVVVPTGDRAAQRDVGARAQPGEQGGQSRLGGHEEAGARAAGQGGEFPVELGRESEGDGVAAVVGDGRPRPVVGQREFLRQLPQSRAPVPELACRQAVRVLLVAEQLVLPQRVVGVLHRQRGSVGGLVPAA